MKKVLSAVLFAASIVWAASAQSQYLNHPPYLKWNRIETQHHEIVYPEGLDSVAQYAANLMNHVHAPVAKTLHKDPRKISFFLFNQSAVSNGYVTPINPMMAWYTTPMQDVSRLGADDWFQSLAVHEYRHVTQFDKMDQNMIHFAKVIGGAYGASALGVLSHPLWFAEGDAVTTETVLTSGGRGRLPSFAAPMRALVLEGKPHRYDRVYLGSYKYYYPNYYTLGYYLSVYGRRHYSEDVWSSVLDDVSRLSVSPYRFSNAMKRKTGEKLTVFHQSAMTELRELWLEQEKGLVYTDVVSLSDTSKRVFTSYTNPLVLPDSRLFAIKTGMDAASQFVIIENGKETKLFNRSPAGSVTASGNTLVWSEFITDIRYLERSYSDIYLYTIDTKKLQRLTKQSKYFAPAISPDGTKIAAVEFTELMQCSLHILDAQTGEVLETHVAAPGEFFRTPAWHASGASIAMQVTKGENNSFVRYTLAGGRETLYGPTTLPIFAPSFVGERLMFCSPATGIDAIHIVDIDSGEEYIVAQTRFGAQHAVLAEDGTSIIFEDYNSDGNSVVQSQLDQSAWRPLSTAPQNAENYFVPLVEQEQGGSIFAGALPDSSFAVSRYSPLKNIINIHSWMLAPEPQGLSLTLFSNDNLNQLGASVGVVFNDNENALSEIISLSYMKYFPVISLTGIHGLRTQSDSYENRLGTTEQFYYHWREQSADLSIEIPLDFSRGHYTRNLSLKWSVLYKRVTDMNLSSQTGGRYADINGRLVPFRFWADIVNVQNASRRDLMPNWGQLVAIRTEYVPTGISDFGTIQYSVIAREYFPGLLPSHGLYIQGGYEWQKPHNWMYRAPSYMAFTRGYDYLASSEWAQIRAGYKFPLFYPDLPLGGTLYFKRVSAEIFADYSKLYDAPAAMNEYSSAGAEITIDIHPFRWIFLPLSIGLRSSYTMETEKIRYEFVLMGATF